MKRILAAVLLSVITLNIGADRSNADIIFTFSGVTFDDGGTLTGTFTADDALMTLVDFDITTSMNGLLGFHYLPSTADSSSTSLPFILVLSDPDHILQVTFTNLSPTGAPITIGTFDSFEQGPSGSRRDIVAGSVVVASAVPEPTTFSLASTAVVVAGAVLTYRRRRRVALD